MVNYKDYQIIKIKCFDSDYYGIKSKKYKNAYILLSWDKGGYEHVKEYINEHGKSNKTDGIKYREAIGDYSYTNKSGENIPFYKLKPISKKGGK